MKSNVSLVAAAVAAALGTAPSFAAPPTLAQAASPGAQLVLAGSSAVQSSMFAALEADLCGGSGNALEISSSGSSSNFKAVSCALATAVSGTPGVPVGTITTFFYRTEGGSVVGALPIASKHNILRLDLTKCTQPVAPGPVTCTIGASGSTTTAATTDTWTGAVVSDNVDVGVTDVEPGQLTGADYPSQYSASAFGSATPAQMKALSTKPLVQQVFGLAVNTSLGGLTAPVNLSRDWAAKVLLGQVTDWSQVPDAISGSAVGSGAIVHVDREPGSGTRTASNIFFERYQCGSTNAISSTSGLFSTGDLMAAANTTKGAIAYTAIDQLQDPKNGTKFGNLTFATIDGVAPSNLAAATGRYSFFFEATLVPATTANTTQDNLATYLANNLPLLSKAPAEPSINAIPGVGTNVKATPPSNNGKAGTSEIYTSTLTRSGNSCNLL